MPEMMNIEVAYGTADKQCVYRLTVQAACTARQAALLAPIAPDFPDADVQAAILGVFGKRVADDFILRDGDRVEVYRALIADPKEARRRRVAQNKEKNNDEN